MKRKGSNAERELVSKFWEHGWAALRIAGSGRMNFPCPDVLAGNGKRIVAIECKSTKHKQQYIEESQIKQLKTFAALFGAEPLVAVKFSSKWHFFEPEILEKTDNGKVVIDKHKHIKNSFSFEELLLSKHR